MRSIMRAGVMALTLTTVVTAASAQTTPGPFQEAGRLVDELTGRLGSFGAELAQQVQQGRGALGSLGGMMGRMMGDPADRPLLTIMLHHQTELGLSAEQVGRLEALRTDFTRDAIRRDADIRVAELDLASLLEQDPADLSKVEAKVREAAQLRADLRIARLRAIEQGKAVLTSEQRTKLQTLLSSGMHQGPGRGRGGAPVPRPSARTSAQL